MKVAIVFYSFSGNTKRVCLYLKEVLQAKGHRVDLEDVKPLREERDFFRQCRQAFFRRLPELQKLNLEISRYEFIIVASPVWAFTYAPALRTYLKAVGDLSSKKAGCFVTYHSGAGAQRALRELANLVRKKGAEVLSSLGLSGERCRDKEYVEKNLSPLIQAL
jgi:flavodoxin